MLNLPFLPEIFLGVMFLVLITCGIVEFIRAPRVCWPVSSCGGEPSSCST